MSPRVSVVMATYNRTQLVGRAIASVRGQSFLDWEMIVWTTDPPMRRRR